MLSRWGLHAVVVAVGRESGRARLRRAVSAPFIPTCRRLLSTTDGQSVSLPTPPPLPKPPKSPKATPPIASAAGVASTKGIKAPEGKLQVDSRLDDVHKRVDMITSLPQNVFEKKYAEFQERERKQSLSSIRDDVFNMSVSERDSATAKKPLKVFYKTVAVVPVEAGWWKVTLDGRSVKALESSDVLLLPSEELALVVAHEWAGQQGVINKLLMPMTDIASGSQLVDQFGIDARLEHLMTFLRSDNIFYRHPQLKAQEEELCEPVCKWFDNYFNVVTPRYDGLQSAKVADSTVKKVSSTLQALKMNKYQVVSLYVVTQYTASVVLATALALGGVDIETALKVNRLEEMYNVASSPKLAVDGYHDIRDADVTVKIAASHTCWKLTEKLTVEQTLSPPSLLKAAARDE